MVGDTNIRIRGQICNKLTMEIVILNYQFTMKFFKLHRNFYNVFLCCIIFHIDFQGSSSNSNINDKRSQSIILFGTGSTIIHTALSFNMAKLKYRPLEFEKETEGELQCPLLAFLSQIGALVLIVILCNTRLPKPNADQVHCVCMIKFSCKCTLRFIQDLPKLKIKLAIN